MLHDLIWAVIALAVLGLLLLLGFGTRRNNLMPSAFITLEDMVEGGLLFIALMIILLPLYPLYLLIAAVWQYFHPIKPLPVKGDDPVWGRDVNEKVTKDAFLAVQQAWMERNPRPIRDLVGDDVYDDLQAECDRLTAQHEINTRQDIQITEVYVHDEHVDDYKLSDGTHAITYYLEVKIGGAMTNVTRREEDGQITAGLPDPHPFEENMQFARGSGEADRWIMVTMAGLPHAKKKPKPKSVHPRRKRRADKKIEVSSH